jgi:hypothetical protein
MKGMVTSIDDKGMATVRTEDGKEHKVKGEGWQVGAQVECEQKEGTTSCKAAKMEAAGRPGLVRSLLGRQAARILSQLRLTVPPCHI